MSRSQQPAAPFAAPRRVFTAPVASTASLSTSSQNGDGVVETLYTHGSARIVAFTAGRSLVSIGSNRALASFSEIEPGSLSWSSQLERTIAVGPFRIYRAPGSVAFLSCGSALQPILPKSQCWCVDEQSSKYVLQIRRPQYWRIEIPVATSDDIEQAQLLRQVLDTILQFEKTECPFKRTFTVDLPERPQTPVKKRPWTPVRKPIVSLPPTPVTPSEFQLGQGKSDVTSVSTSAKDGVPAETVEAPVDSQIESSLFRASSPSIEDGQVIQPAKRLEANLISTPELSVTLDTVPDQHKEHIPSVETITTAFENLAALSLVQAKSGGFQASRSVTAPLQLALITPELSTAGSTAASVTEPGSASHSRTASQESFHSIKSWQSPGGSLPPSPPLSNPDSSFAFPTQENLDREVSSPGSSEQLRAASMNDESSAPVQERPTTAPHDDRTEEAATTTSISTEASVTTVTRRPPGRNRATTSSSISPVRRTLSPLPTAASLFAPRRRAGSALIQNKLSVVRRLPMAVIKKTCEILLSPPSHLVNLMLNVAARIAAGEWSGFMFGTGEGGETIPVQWDWSDADDDGDGELDGWGADEDLPQRGRSGRMAGSFPQDDDSVSGSGPEDEQYAPLTRDADVNWGVD